MFEVIFGWASAKRAKSGAAHHAPLSAVQTGTCLNGLSNSQSRSLSGGSWNNIAAAPRDGTIVEIRNSYGILPTYGLYRWVGRWQDVRNHDMGVSDGPHLTWRVFGGDVGTYQDHFPSLAEWRRAAGVRP